MANLVERQLLHEVAGEVRALGGPEAFKAHALRHLQLKTVLKASGRGLALRPGEEHAIRAIWRQPSPGHPSLPSQPIQACQAALHTDMLP
jgi:hypothetical protein